MLARALIVLLLVLNVGVAAWWMARAPHAAMVPVAPPAGVARLRLITELPATAAPARGPGAAITAVAAGTSPANASGMTTPTVAAAGSLAMQCFSAGPYPAEQAAQAARERLQSLPVAVVVREQRRAGARGWRVWLAPLASAEQAGVIAQRISAAGFDDYFVMREGDEANAIALGRYGNETAARRRAEALVAAGFAARAEPLGGIAFWLDVTAAIDSDAVTAQRIAAAPRLQPRDCATLQGGPPPPR